MPTLPVETCASEKVLRFPGLRPDTDVLQMLFSIGSEPSGGTQEIEFRRRRQEDTGDVFLEGCTTPKLEGCMAFFGLIRQRSCPGRVLLWPWCEGRRGNEDSRGIQDGVVSPVDVGISRKIRCTMSCRTLVRPTEGEFVRPTEGGRSEVAALGTVMEGEIKGREE